ncbi:UbiH/UbiF/VisC/COQ6 family ubiquinone biosynthesis hydroxylase [Agaribacter flavus]|uniref:UbiH/UbiF/VisC/COQ6 family ubiquinone biosynthesis hydroxylase n=1 Tax=Agaribacter flavus TaxID=1902781 RepID=A0ABV7FP57_9ALTE
MNCAKLTTPDVCIVGGGIVGLTLALLLSKHNIHILLIDKAERTLSEASQSEHFSARVSAISQASEQIFDNLGVWQTIHRKQAYKQMSVWDQHGFGRIQFDGRDRPNFSLGHIVENQVLTDALLTKLQQRKNVEVLQGTSLVKAQFLNANSNKSQYQISLDNQQDILTDLLIGADGANSIVKKIKGFAEVFWDYEHTAIVANLKTEHAHDAIARQAFTPSGPLAFLPLPDPHQCSIVWSQTPQRANRLLALSPTEFCKVLLKDIDGQLGLCTLSSERYSFPLKMRYAKQWYQDSAVLVGDAAHTIHPLAGQGANLGIADAEALANSVADSIAKCGRVNDYRSMRKYERARKSQAIAVIASMESFKRIFAGSNSFKKVARNVALSTADKMPLLKQFFITSASKA